MPVEKRREDARAAERSTVKEVEGKMSGLGWPDVIIHEQCCATQFYICQLRSP